MFHWSSRHVCATVHKNISEMLHATHARNRWRKNEENEVEGNPEIHHWHFILLSNQSVLNTFCSHRNEGKKRSLFDWGENLAKNNFNLSLPPAIVSFHSPFIHCTSPDFSPNPHTLFGQIAILHFLYACMHATIAIRPHATIASAIEETPPLPSPLPLWHYQTADCRKLGAVPLPLPSSTPGRVPGPSPVDFSASLFFCTTFAIRLSMLCLHPYANAIFAANGVRALLSYATGVMEPHPPDPALKVAPTSAHIVLYSWAWSRFRFWAWASTWANEPSPRNNGHKTWPQERSGSGRSLKHYS